MYIMCASLSDISHVVMRTRYSRRYVISDASSSCLRFFSVLYVLPSLYFVQEINMYGTVSSTSSV